MRNDRLLLAAPGMGRRILLILLVAVANRSPVVRVAFMMEKDEAPSPVDAGLLRTVGVVLGAERLPQLIQQPGRIGETCSDWRASVKWRHKSPATAANGMCTYVYIPHFAWRQGIIRGFPV
jgi:hypothetical protein